MLDISESGYLCAENFVVGQRMDGCDVSFHREDDQDRGRLLGESSSQKSLKKSSKEFIMI